MGFFTDLALLSLVRNANGFLIAMRHASFCLVSFSDDYNSIFLPLTSGRSVRQEVHILILLSSTIELVWFLDLCLYYLCRPFIIYLFSKNFSFEDFFPTSFHISKFLKKTDKSEHIFKNSKQIKQ